MIERLWKKGFIWLYDWMTVDRLDTLDMLDRVDRYGWVTGRHVRQGSHTVQMDVFLADTGMFENMLYNLRMYHSDVRKGGITLPLLEMTIVDGVTLCVSGLIRCMRSTSPTQMHNILACLLLDVRAYFLRWEIFGFCTPLTHAVCSQPLSHYQASQCDLSRHI